MLNPPRGLFDKEIICPGNKSAHSGDIESADCAVY